MKKLKLLTAVMVGLLRLPGLMGAEEVSSHDLEMFGHYEAIRLAMVGDSMEGTADHAKSIEKLTSALRESIAGKLSGAPSEDLEPWVRALEEMELSARRLATTEDLISARGEFFTLTRTMAMYRKLSGDETTVIVYCSMAEKAWIQPRGEIGNPYMGQTMPKCGEIISEKEG